MSIAVRTGRLSGRLTAAFAARLAASVWDDPAPGAPAPLSNLVALGRQLPPVWRRQPVITAPDLPGDRQDAGDPEAETPGAEGLVSGGLVAEDMIAAHIARFDDRWLIENATAWEFLARPEQLPPDGAWRTWLMMGGRGSGKTRAGAEWVHALASGDLPGLGRDGRIALVAESFGDAREVMIDGISGILGVARAERPSFEATRRRLVWPSGAVAQMFSSEDPESLRGPQFDLAWCDELGKWRHARETWDMLQFGLRLGTSPRQLVTTTPRATPLMLALVKDAATRVTRIRTEDNAANLAAGFLETIRARYGGTRLGRQELDGELIADREDGLWRRDQIEALIVRSHGPLARIVVAVDPPASGEAKHSCCGIVAVGLDTEGRAVVLADGSVEGASPTRWAEAAARLYRRFDADCVVAEINQGGDMVTSVLRTVDPTLPVRQPCGRRAASGCAPNRWRHFTSRAGWRTLATLRRARGPDVRFRPPTGCPPAARPTGSTRWSGR